MACLEQQETAEYYHWLFKIEQTEFEKELLDIVHTSTIIKFNLFWNYFNSFLLYSGQDSTNIFCLQGYKRILYTPDEVTQV